MSKFMMHKCSICDREDIVEMLHLEGVVPESMIKMVGSLTHNEKVMVSVCFLCFDKFRDALITLGKEVRDECNS